MSDIHYSDLMRKVEEVLVIDVYHHASMIPDNLLETLKDPVQGIYMKGSYTPLITKGGSYYHGNSKTPLTFEEIVNTKKNIYDPAGNLILPAEQYVNFPQSFITEPPMFATAIGLTTTVALKALDELCPYFKPSRNALDYSKFVKEGFEYLIEDGTYDEKLHSIAREVIDFVNYDNWNMYFHKVKGGSLIIEKNIDFRIYDWHRIQYELSNPQEQ